MAVLVRVGHRLLQTPLGPHGIAQNPVDQTVTARGPVLPGKADGFVHRRAVRYLVQIINLIESQVQDIPHRRVELFDRAL